MVKMPVILLTSHLPSDIICAYQHKQYSCYEKTLFITGGNIMNLTIEKPRLIVLLVLTISVVLTIFMTGYSKQEQHIDTDASGRVATTIMAPVKAADRETTYKSQDGWKVRYDSRDITASKIDSHSTQFVYQGKAAGTCMVEIKYIAYKGPEDVLYDVTSEWGNQRKIARSEGLMPGTNDKWAFTRELTSGKKGSHLNMCAIAGEYNNGTLLFTVLTHASDKDAIDMPMMAAISGVIESITYTNYKDQKMFTYHPGTYKAARGNKAYKSVVLKKDHTGIITDAKGRKTNIIWSSGELTDIQTGESCAYTYAGASLAVDMNGHWVEFSK